MLGRIFARLQLYGDLFLLTFPLIEPTGRFSTHGREAERTFQNSPTGWLTAGEAAPGVNLHLYRVPGDTACR